MTDLQFEKISNAYIPDLLRSPATAQVAEATLREQYRHQFGGLWLGGRVVVARGRLSFHPNPRAQNLHVDLKDVHIALADIRSVRREFGWVSGIVVVEHSDGLFRFRCFGARGVATRLMAACAPR
jgi:hypothetical protein